MRLLPALMFVCATTTAVSSVFASGFTTSNARAAAGQNDAVAGVTAKARQQKMDAINYWTSRYDGSDLTAGKFKCVAPLIPSASSTAAEARAVEASYEAYRQCYNAFVDNAYIVPASRVPADVAQVMTDEEYDMAANRLEAIYQTAQARAAEQASHVAAARAKWASVTVASVNAASERDKWNLIAIRTFPTDYTKQFHGQLAIDRTPVPTTSH